MSSRDVDLYVGTGGFGDTVAVRWHPLIRSLFCLVLTLMSVRFHTFSADCRAGTSSR